MDTNEMSALEESILHWEDNLSLAMTGNRGRISISYKDCALCKIYATLSLTTRKVVIDCCGCPVFNKTGKPGCTGTPYNKVYTAISRGKSDSFLIKAIQEEVDFLKSLLPAS